MPKNINKEPGGRSTPPCPACRGSGLVMLFTSARPCENSGTIVSQVALVYNDFAQLVSEPQSHSGAVTSTTPAVGYVYDTGDFGSNEIRLTGLIYPNGRPIGYSFGAPGGMNDLLNRVESIQDNSSGTTDLATYTYIGAGTVVRVAYPEPQIWLDLWGGVLGQFQGLDQFGRIIDQRWQNYATSPASDIDRYPYGYDPNSNPKWKANVVGTPNVTGGLDEIYTNDNLNRLTDMRRGVLNAARTALTATAAREMIYTLDPTGNWSNYLTQTNGTTDLNQGRVSNLVNEITSITASGGTPVWVTPVYDGAGNMTTMPQPGTPTSSFVAVYDAWNRMVKINSGGVTVGQYQYDGRNFRIVTLTTEARHFFFTSGWQDVEQRVGTATTADQQHVWGIRYINELVCRDDATPERRYATQDANFNVTGIVNSTGAPQQRFVYDPYGTATIYAGVWTISSDSLGWVPRFTGQRYDAESEIYLYRERYYLPGLGRFGSRDPILSVAQTIVPSEPRLAAVPSWVALAATGSVHEALANAKRGIQARLGSGVQSQQALLEYADGLNLYEYCRSSPAWKLDPFGLIAPVCHLPRFTYICNCFGVGTATITNSIECVSANATCCMNACQDAAYLGGSQIVLQGIFATCMAWKCI